MEKYILNLERMNEIVGYELNRINKGETASPQQILRSIYQNLRLNQLGEEGRKRTLRKAIAKAKIKCPDFIPKYDEKFFLE